MDVGFLETLYHRAGPCACVYLNADRAPAADHMIDLRWRELRARLEQQGADFRTLGALDEAVGSDPGQPSPHGQALFAADGKVLLQEGLRVPTTADRATLAEVPDVMPLLAQYPDIPAHVLVVVDCTGADIEVLNSGGVCSRGRVRGADYPVSKIGTGDWNQPRYQRRAENTWDANARSTAKTVEWVAASHHAAMIAVAGDVRARTLLVEHLDPVWRPRAAVLESAQDGANGARERSRDEAAVIAAEFEEAARAQVRERFARGLTDGAAVEGLAPTVEAMRTGVVDTLLLRYGDEESEAPTWWGPEPGQLAVRSGELADVRAQQARRDRAADVLVRALVRMRGRLLVVAKGEPGPVRGVGAVLRYS